MTELEKALQLGLEEPNKQHIFYDLFLNTIFYIPIVDDEKDPDKDGALPLLVEANDNTYLMLFDSVEKLADWANESARHIPVYGHSITEISSSNIYWALNYGTESQKFFDPEEITWLKGIVQKINKKQAAEADKKTQQNEDS